jgi:hypothetical protein
MKIYGGVEVIVSRILNLDITWRFVVSYTHRPLYPREKSPRYPVDNRLGGPQIRSGQGGEEKILSPCRELNPGLLAHI